MEMEMDNAIVLLSGGWESAACLIKAKERWQSPMALFVNYGQPYLAEEQLAVLQITNALQTTLAVETIDPMPRAAKVFKSRNEIFLKLAARYHPQEIYFGARSPLKIFDRYGDSNWQFAQDMATQLKTPITTPLIMWPKPLIKKFVKQHINQQYIFSSEGYQYVDCQ